MSEEDAEKTRANGQTPGEDEAKELSKDLTNPVNLDNELPVGLTRAFQRMRTDWNSSDRDTIKSVQHTIERKIYSDFDEAFGIIYKIYNQVRFPEVDEKTGEVITDSHGFPIWRKSSDGHFLEDWSRISIKFANDIQYEVLTKMFSWQQTAANAWGEALFAKGQWEEAFATAFDTSTPKGKDTDASRTALANRRVAEYRYLAICKAIYSKRADAVISSLQHLSQRLKDINT